MEISKINIDKNFEILKNKVDKLIVKNKVENYGNKKDIHTTIYNIDSAYRNKYTKNILDNNIYNLKNNALTFTLNSLTVKINIPNHNLKAKDRIILENVKGYKKILSNNIFLINNFNYGLIKLENHKLTSYNIIQKINIIPLNNLQRYYGNIPSNSIIGLKTIILSSSIDIPNEIYDNLNITIDDLIKDYIFIELPFNYLPQIIINENIIFSDFYTISDIFNFEIMNLSGVPLTYLNANYPINYERYIGFHEIEHVDLNNIYIDLKMYSNNNLSGGGDQMVLAKIIKNIEGFIDSNEYTIHLKKSFTNVTRISLVSTEFFFIDNLIKNSNNKLYWQHYDYSNYIYKISIKE